MTNKGHKRAKGGVRNQLNESIVVAFKLVADKNLLATKFHPVLSSLEISILVYQLEIMFYLNKFQL